MNRIRFSSVLLIACVQFLSSQNQLLVTTAWVDDHKNDPNVILFQVSGNRKGFLNGHIPGARFLWFDHLSPSNPDESTALPTMEQAKSSLEELGVSNASRVILYGGPNVVTLLTRTYLMFEYLGIAQNVSIMSGGMDAWKSEKRVTSTETSPTIQRGNVSITAHPNLIVDVDWVKNNLKNPSVAIVDARGKRAYDGAPGGPQRSGHIFGAKLVVIDSLVDSLNRFKSPDILRKYFADAGINPNSKIVTYCWVGQMATVPYFAAKLLGYDAALFDGSWEIWSAMDESYPVEQTPPPPKVGK